jgi:hypothetical protein
MEKSHDFVANEVNWLAKKQRSNKTQKIVVFLTNFEVLNSKKK